MSTNYKLITSVELAEAAQALLAECVPEQRGSLDDLRTELAGALVGHLGAGVLPDCRTPGPLAEALYQAVACEGPEPRFGRGALLEAVARILTHYGGGRFVRGGTFSAFEQRELQARDYVLLAPDVDIAPSCPWHDFDPETSWRVPEAA